MKALVTGGGGFLGRAIVERLLAEGHDVAILARGSYPEVEALGVTTLRGDIGDPAAMTHAAEGRDVVFHVAAKAGVWGDRAEFRRTNVEGTANVVAACRAAGVPRLVHTSSPSVVFDGKDHVDATADGLPYPARFDAIYPETKAAAERLVLDANGPSLATVALRPHLVWGPRDPHLLPRLFARARAGKLRRVGPGDNRVSVTYVDNAAAAHVQAAAALAPGAACAGRAYFVNDPAPIALWPWLNALFGRLGIPPVTRGVPLWAGLAAGSTAEAAWSLLGLAGEPPLTRFVALQLATTHTYDVGPAVRDFGYAPPVGPEEAVERTVGWWRDHLPHA